MGAGSQPPVRGSIETGAGDASEVRVPALFEVGDDFGRARKVESVLETVRVVVLAELACAEREVVLDSERKRR